MRITFVRLLTVPPGILKRMQTPYRSRDLLRLRLAASMFGLILICCGCYDAEEDRQMRDAQREQTLENLKALGNEMHREQAGIEAAETPDVQDVENVSPTDDAASEDAQTQETGPDLSQKSHQ